MDNAKRGAIVRPASCLDRREPHLNTQYLDIAKERIPNVPLLINAVTRRVRQLNQGQRPLVKPDSHSSNLDIALKEIAEGKLPVEVVFTPPPPTVGDNVISL